VDQALLDYLGRIPPEHRPLFDRLHGIILEEHPDATVGISYAIPTYKVGRRRLFLGVWKHGVSIYGWGEDRDAGFSARHPDLKSGAATLQLRPDAAAGIPDQEFRNLVHAALDPE
jgi:hypothetical protein